MIVVVGDIVTDVLALTLGSVTYGSDTPAAITMVGGGAGANTAAWLAALDEPVRLVTAVGTDEVAALRLAELTRAGVECVVRKDSHRPTGSIVVLSDGDERTMLTDRGANQTLTPADIDRGLAGATHLHLSGYVLLDKQSRPAGQHALWAAAAAGLTTSVDAASAAPLRAAPDFMTWVRGTDLLLANVDEAAVLAGSESTDAVQLATTLARSVARVIVKRGAAGAVYATGDQAIEAPGEPAEVVDPTGAGDAFAAGAIAAWRAGAPPRDCLLAGARLGAKAVAKPGARPG